MAERAKCEKRFLRKSKNYQKEATGRSEAFQHILNKRLAESQGWIFAEDLKIKELMHNNFLAKAVADCTWGSFLHKPEYKSRLYGRTLLKVLERGTTQICSKRV